MSELDERLNAALVHRYRIVREIGRGGAAIIYLAEDLRHGRRVALKVLRPDLAASLGAGRFLREIKIAANLAHPHILPVHDSGEVGGFVFYVMPLVEGQSLRARLGREHSLPVADTVRLLHDVLDALHYAHERGIVHRDIKPDNVLLSGRHGVVTDFGVAKAVSVAAEGHDVDTLGMVIGTPAYMAPEQASADPNVDLRADIYSVGALAYEMLAGRPPFQGLSPQAVLAAHVQQPVEPVTNHRSDIPPALAHVVRKCLEKRPDDRWQTAEEVLEFLDSEITPVETRVSTPVSLRKLTQRPRHLMIGVWAVAAVLVLALGWVLWGPEPATASSRPLLVVLPFENLGPPEDEYFALGISDAITARLAGMSTLGVISRTSARRYRGSDLTAQQIGDELGVDFILEGTLQRERPSDPTSQVRIIPQLIRVSDDSQLWAEVYDENMTAVFRLQSDIADRVARALNVALLEPIERSLGERPTDNLEAYELYLRGHDYLEGNVESGDANARRIAIELLEAAIAVDATFAEAWAELAMAHLWLFRWYVDPSAERLASAKAAVDTALALAPALPAAHLALGHYYVWGTDSNRDRALEEFQLVVKGDPSDAHARSLLATLQAARGDWDEALSNAALATDLDPRDAELAASAGKIYLLARRFEEAERHLHRAFQLEPDDADANRGRLALYLAWRADTARARDVLRDMAQYIAPGEVAKALVEIAPLLVVGGEYDSLFQDLTPGSLAGPLPFDYFDVKAEFYRLRGRTEQANAYYDSLLTAVDSWSGGAVPAVAVALLRGRANAGLGRKPQAMKQAAALEAYISTEDDAILAASVRTSLARIYALIGEEERAVDHIEELLEVPSPLSIPYLRIQVFPEALFSHPRLERLTADS